VFTALPAVFTDKLCACTGSESLFASLLFVLRGVFEQLCQRYFKLETTVFATIWGNRLFLVASVLIN